LLRALDENGFCVETDCKHDMLLEQR